MRPHVAAVYAFARAADDFADEGVLPVDDRHRLLDAWRSRLRSAITGSPATMPDAPRPGEPDNTQDIFLALGATIRGCQLPSGLFEDLLSAFRQDVTVTRYATWDHLFDYCRRSANPVGRIMLRIGGFSDRQFDEWSDALCTALQLTNFWQDLESDFGRGRIYLPLEEMARHGAEEQSLVEGRLTSGWELALAAAAGRTRTLYDAGRPLCDHVRGRLRYELRATWLGGTRILDRLESLRFGAIGQRPSLGAADVPWLIGAMTTWGIGAPGSRAEP